MNFYVYLICTKDNNNKLISYVGYTKNLKNRLFLHNNSTGAKFTKGRKWKLLYKKKFFTKTEAMQYEYILKKNIKLRNMIKSNYSNEII